jgi:hypothetical protein
VFVVKQAFAKFERIVVVHVPRRTAPCDDRHDDMHCCYAHCCILSYLQTALGQRVYLTESARAQDTEPLQQAIQAR